MRHIREVADTEVMLVGVLSDTHGLLRPQMLERLAGADLILHAGDVGKPDILQALNTVAPTFAVRGNVDRGEWADELPERLIQEIEGVRVLMLHDLKALGPIPSGARVIVSGHTHVPSIEERGGVLFLNPGSCGPRRFKLPVSMAFLRVQNGTVSAEPVTLGV